MESYYEQSLAGRNSSARSVLYALSWLLIVLLFLLAVFFAAGIPGSDPQRFEINWLNAAALLICLAIAGALFRGKDHLRTDYDYILKGDVLEVVAILNQRRRKRIAVLDLKRIQSAGLFSSHRCESMMKQPGSKVRDCRVEQGGYYLYYNEANVRRMVLLNPDDQMAALIHRQLSAGVWQNIEGE